MLNPFYVGYKVIQHCDIALRERRSITITRLMFIALGLSCGSCLLTACHLKAYTIYRLHMLLLSRSWQAYRLESLCWDLNLDSKRTMLAPPFSPHIKQSFTKSLPLLKNNS
ncbi:uncharacterized protein LOC119982232 [Tripterygium wilfordii]|uniref:uncharacterized protein LOC119982232 n=1 Tax=Tripterygium wilfordii TaxID=458696 RepID=UPI0018F7ED18|nr:uncharacterized protein LOC119982232 [Tripterygium wilfordii]